jgi:hypothetical protein
MPEVDYMGPRRTTDFVDAVRIVEVKDRDYTFSFVNSFTGNIYILRVYKEVFDEMMEGHKVIEMKVDIVDPAKAMQDEMQKASDMVR